MERVEYIGNVIPTQRDLLPHSSAPQHFWFVLKRTRFMRSDGIRGDQAMKYVVRPDEISDEIG